MLRWFPCARDVRRVLPGAPLTRAALLLAVSIAAYLVTRRLTDPSSIDLRVYRAEGAAVRAHLDIYADLHAPQALQATYPPFAACVFVPLTWLPAAWLPTAGLVVNLGLLIAVAHLSVRLAGSPAHGRAAATMTVAAVVLWAEPVFTTLRNGQLNLLLLALVLSDFVRPPRSRWMGVGIGLAAGLKVTPVIFIGYLAVTGRFRAAGTALATFAATVAVSAVVVPDATRHYWSSLVFDSGRVGHIEDEGNQSLFGVLARVSHTALRTPTGTAVAVLIAVAGAACAVFAGRRLGDRWGAPACAVVGLLVAPIAWTHHWVWLIPISVLLWWHARAWLVPTVVVFWSYLVWVPLHAHVGDELKFAAPVVALSALYALWGLAFLALVATRTLHRSPAPADAPQVPTGRPHPAKLT
ncbi:MAG TPA: glycosyltransferase 87 family protein [Jatrophihabitans sp.]|nr:glycosyltransferase 87 family protein [Jatrophihabitans sp.]